MGSVVLDEIGGCDGRVTDCCTLTPIMDNIILESTFYYFEISPLCEEKAKMSKYTFKKDPDHKVLLQQHLTFYQDEPNIPVSCIYSGAPVTFKRIF